MKKSKRGRKTKASGGKTPRKSAIYEVDAASLKAADRTKRVLRAVAVIALQLAFLFLLTWLIGLYALVVYLIAALTFLPNPVVPTPSKYKITSDGVLFDNGRKIFVLREGYRLKLNEERRFVSVLQRWRGEIFRLYTPEPRKVLKILDQLIQRAERASMSRGKS